MKKILFIFCLFALIISCSESDDSGEISGGVTGETSGFNRNALLANWVNNYIKPAFNNFDAKLAALKVSQNQFTTTPTEDHLVVLQNDLFEAQKAWQHVAMFEFGKAEELNYRSFMNSYPVDFKTTADDSQEDDNTITKNLESGTLPIADINFELDRRNNEQGFPTVDYMVNGLASNNADIVAFYTTYSFNKNYKDYLSRIIDRMVSLTNEVVIDWNTNGDAVINNDGSSDAASFDKLANDFVNYTERAFRENKIATPSGKRNGVKKPEAVESFYSSENAKALFLEAYKTIQAIYYGNSFSDNTEGQGIDDYLTFLETTVFDTEARQTKTMNAFVAERFSAIDAIVATLDNNFVTQVETNNLDLLETFNKIQQFVTLYKTNIISALDVRIDFADSDGD